MSHIAPVLSAKCPHQFSNWLLNRGDTKGEFLLGSRGILDFSTLATVVAVGMSLGGQLGCGRVFLRCAAWFSFFHL